LPSYNKAKEVKSEVFSEQRYASKNKLVQYMIEAITRASKIRHIYLGQKAAEEALLTIFMLYSVAKELIFHFRHLFLPGQE
jgi:hypothetical protein